ncbi:MAG TPA: NAD(P)/FAD-dependent oxidoreductase [Jiangellaceae bacterium]
MTERVNTVVVGGGQAGLSMSYCLSPQNHEHLVLERSRVAEHWRSRVWDSFCLVTPNWTVQLPGMPYDGPDPDGFMGRNALVAHLERYAAYVSPPLRTGVTVSGVRPSRWGDAYLLDTTGGTLATQNVVVATGGCQHPTIPRLASNFAAFIHQIHSSEYRNAGELPDGAVLVVGSGQSGAQIAEELYQSGRRVYLCVSRCGRVPRRYRGRDTMWWMVQMGILDQPAERSPVSQGAGCNSHVSGKNGGHDLNLWQFACDGVVLLGRLEDAAGTKIRLAGDLQRNLHAADATAARIMERIDEFIAKTGTEAPQRDPVDPQRGSIRMDAISELDIGASGIKTIVWATGYRHDFGWLQVPGICSDGKPIHRRGVTRLPGLFFLGLRQQHTVKSELLLGVGADAGFLAEHITAGTTKIGPV